MPGRHLREQAHRGLRTKSRRIGGRALPTDPGFVLNEITPLRLRALLARTRGGEAAYRDFRDRYRAMATSLGFEGHIAWAEAML
jgi:hypothetical protein